MNLHEEHVTDLTILIKKHFSRKYVLKSHVTLDSSQLKLPFCLRLQNVKATVKFLKNAN